MKVTEEMRMTMKVLAEKGQSRREIARVLGLDESTVRYHLERQAKGATDGRARQPFLAERWAEHIEHYRLSRIDDGGINLVELHEWLQEEKAYPGSLRSVQRFYRHRYPAPKKRARRRVETPPGAQAQVDWAEWPRLWVGGRQVYGYEFHMRLSHSRRGARVWSPRKDQLAWHTVHNESFRRLDGVAATVRIDNEKTGMSHGAGSWGEINPSYARYAAAVRFHIDPCPPRSPRFKGKVERGIRTGRLAREIRERRWESWQELQAWTDEKELRLSETTLCQATGTPIVDAWEAEKRCLAPVPLLPEPFDLAQMRVVAEDCTVAFEARRFSVPFPFVGRRIEVRGCSQVVQMWHDGEIIAQHPRDGRERLVLDSSHYEGEATGDVLPPIPLGRMGRRLQEIAEMKPEQRPLDLYAALAGVAR